MVGEVTYYLWVGLRFIWAEFRYMWAGLEYLWEVQRRGWLWGEGILSI